MIYPNVAQIGIFLAIEAHAISLEWEWMNVSEITAEE